MCKQTNKTPKQANKQKPKMKQKPHKNTLYPKPTAIYNECLNNDMFLSKAVEHLLLLRI